MAIFYTPNCQTEVGQLGTWKDTNSAFQHSTVFPPWMYAYTIPYYHFSNPSLVTIGQILFILAQI